MAVRLNLMPKNTQKKVLQGKIALVAGALAEQGGALPSR